MFLLYVKKEINSKLFDLDLGFFFGGVSNIKIIGFVACNLKKHKTKRNINLLQN